MSYAIDTNILARSVEKDHPHHEAASMAVAALLRQRESINVLAQNLYEFWVVATRPREQNGMGLTAQAAVEHLARFEMIFSFKPDSSAIYPEWKNLVSSYAVMGKNAHDARIVAAMMVYGITRILTFNGDHFKRFAGIYVVEPGDINQGITSK